jgi:hypothetical protein
MSNWTPEQIAEDRLVSKYARAAVAMRATAHIMDKPLPHSPYDVQALKRLSEDLNAYLAELER